MTHKKSIHDGIKLTLTSTDEIQHEDNWCDEHVETHCFMLLTMSSYDDGLITTDRDYRTDHETERFKTLDMVSSG